MAMAFSTNAQSSKDNTLTFNVNGVTLVMKRVAGGTFWMGAQGEDPNDLHVIRGGNFESLDRQCRVSFQGLNLDELLYGIGFRLVFSE